MARPRGLMDRRDASPDRGGLDGGQRLLLGAQELRRAVVRRSPAARRQASPGPSRVERKADPASTLHPTRPDRGAVDAAHRPPTGQKRKAPRRAPFAMFLRALSYFGLTTRGFGKIGLGTIGT